MRPEVSVIVPAYNERRRIGPTLDALIAALGGTAAEIIVADDGSTDGTADFARTFPGVRCVAGMGNRGKGAAIRMGMASATGTLRVYLDADGSTSPDQLPALLEPLRKGEADVAIGSRYIAGAEVAVPQPFWRRWFSRAANRLNQAVLVPGIVDTHCGFKAFTAEAAETIFPNCEIDGWSIDLEVLALATSHRMRIAEVPVRWVDDRDSRGRAIHMVRAIADLVRIRGRLPVR